MYIFENINLALAGLKANKMRALLTMLGIIIGIGSVIGIVMVGNSLTNSVTDSMQGLGATNIIAVLQQKDRGSSSPLDVGISPDENDLITDEMVEQLQHLYSSDIQAVSLSNSLGSGKAEDGRLYANLSITGINQGYEKANNIEILYGRGMREGDLKGNRYVAMVSDKLVGNMFKPGIDPLGKEIKVAYSNQFQTFTIIGVYKHVDSMMGAMMGSRGAEKDISTALYIPISTSQVLSSADKGYQVVTVMAKSGVDVKVFRETIKNFFNTYYENNVNFEIGVMDMETAMASMTTMLGTISVAIAVIAAISLLVGGIGVMNIMLVSVTERTREIGTRKALGARNSYIMTQFIVEAVIICVIGGIIGVMVGMGIGYIGSYLLGFPAAPDISIIIISVMFSMVIGVFFGYYPAKKAAHLDPIEALRYE